MPSDALYGIQTLRSKENYTLSGTTIFPEIIKAYAHLKKAAAGANAQLGKLDPALSLEIIGICDELITWKYKDQFIVDIYQAGAGTATHMNVNEVIANKILENRGLEKGSYDIVSPNDHVNMSQSTNDTYPSAMRLALYTLSLDLETACKAMIDALQEKAQEYKQTITSARTHLQDAVPITIGQELWAYCLSIESCLQQYIYARENLKKISLGGSATWTGINTHPEYQKTVVEFLGKQTGIDFIAHENMIEGTQSQRQIGEYMSALKALSLEMHRIMSDLRLLSSGPYTGLGEIKLPAVQPGSSIMPGKVNPSILEAAHMVCMRIFWAETTVSYTLAQSQLNLNVWMPLMATESIEATQLFINMCDMLREKCFTGIEVNTERCKQYAYESNGIFTALNPILGYARVAKLVKQREETGKSLEELLSDIPDISPSEIQEILDPKKLSNI